MLNEEKERFGIDKEDLITSLEKELESVKSYREAQEEAEQTLIDKLQTVTNIVVELEEMSKKGYAFLRKFEAKPYLKEQWFMDNVIISDRHDKSAPVYFIPKELYEANKKPDQPTRRDKAFK
jgi:hypothetical protein